MAHIARDTKKKPIKKKKEEDKKKVVQRRLYAKTDTKLGARSKFDEVNEEIIKRTREGLSKKDRIAGLIHDSTYKEWLAAGEQDLINGIESQFSLFSFNISSAEKEYRQGLLDCIKKHAPDDWKAASWLIERSCPDSFKLKDKVDMTSNGETLNGHIILVSELETIDQPNEE